MTVEQLTQEIISLRTAQIKLETERDNVMDIIKEMREDIKATKELTEDVHIMAINMQNMQATIQEANNKIEETNGKVEALSKKDYNEYEKAKGIVKANVLSGVTGAIVTGLIGVVIFIIKYIMKEGV